MDNDTKLTQAEATLESIDLVYRQGEYLTDNDMEYYREQVQTTLTDLADAQPVGQLKEDLIGRNAVIEEHFASGVAPRGVLVAVIIAAGGPIRQASA